MKNTKAEARAYNDTIKNSMSLENKLEILYLDLIDYVATVNKYDYFYQDLEKSLNKIIDNYSKSGKSLESKVKELITKKEAEA